MAIFNSYVSLPEGKNNGNTMEYDLWKFVDLQYSPISGKERNLWPTIKVVFYPPSFFWDKTKYPLVI